MVNKITTTTSEYVMLKTEHLLPLIKFIETKSNKINEDQTIKLLKNCYESMVLIKKENVNELLLQQNHHHQKKCKKNKKKAKKKIKKKKKLIFNNHGEKARLYHMKIAKRLGLHLENRLVYGREFGVVPKSKQASMCAQKIVKYLGKKNSKNELKIKRANKKVPKEKKKVQNEEKKVKKHEKQLSKKEKMQKQKQDIEDIIHINKEKKKIIEKKNEMRKLEEVDNSAVTHINSAGPHINKKRKYLSPKATLWQGNRKLLIDLI